MRGLRTIATGLILAAGLALGLLPAAAHAAGPGVTLFVNTNPQPIDVPGDRFASGLSLRSLLQQNGVDPAAVSFVTVTRGDGGLVTLQQADLDNPPALIIDNGTTTRFVRAATPRQEVTATADSGPLQISVNAGDISVTASVDRPSVKAGERVTFTARVRFAPPGAQLSFEWDFGDGSAPRTGGTVRHVYDGAGNYPARVTVRGSGGSTQRCATTCTGTDDVDVTVGEPPPQPTTTTPGGGSGDLTAPGSSSGSGPGGQGGTGGDGSGTGTTPSTGTTEEPAVAAPKPPPPPPPPKKRPFGVTISGVLINDPGATVTKLPAGEPAGGAPEGRRQTQGGNAGMTIELPLGGMLALALFTLGALRERRGVKLRLA